MSSTVSFGSQVLRRRLLSKHRGFHHILDPKIIFLADNIGRKPKPGITDIEAEAIALDRGVLFMHSKQEQVTQSTSVGNSTNSLPFLGFHGLFLLQDFGTIFISLKLFIVSVWLNPGKRQTLFRRMTGKILQWRHFKRLYFLLL